MLKNGKRSEASEQAALFQWAQYKPELEYMYAIPNGGTRNPAEAASLKRQGVKAGVSDISLSVPKGKYHGLFIEMKVGRNIPSENQVKFALFENKNGYCAVLCYGFDEAREVLMKYLKGEDMSQYIKGWEKWVKKYKLEKEWADAMKTVCGGA